MSNENLVNWGSNSVEKLDQESKEQLQSADAELARSIDSLREVTENIEASGGKVNTEEVRMRLMSLQELTARYNLSNIAGGLGALAAAGFGWSAFQAFAPTAIATVLSTPPSWPVTIPALTAVLLWVGAIASYNNAAKAKAEIESRK